MARPILVQRLFSFSTDAELSGIPSERFFISPTDVDTEFNNFIGYLSTLEQWLSVSISDTGELREKTVGLLQLKDEVLEEWLKIQAEIEASAQIAVDAAAAAAASQAIVEQIEASMTALDAALRAFVNQTMIDLNDLIAKFPYLGAYSAPPTSKLDGQPLEEGFLYFDTTSKQMFRWGAGATDPALKWRALVEKIREYGTHQVFKMTPPVTQMSVGTLDTLGNPLAYQDELVAIYVNGERLSDDDYSTSVAGNAIVFTTALAATSTAATDPIEIVVDSFEASAAAPPPLLYHGLIDLNNAGEVGAIPNTSDINAFYHIKTDYTGTINPSIPNLDPAVDVGSLTRLAVLTWTGTHWTVITPSTSVMRRVATIADLAAIHPADIKVGEFALVEDTDKIYNYHGTPLHWQEIGGKSTNLAVLDTVIELNARTTSSVVGDTVWVREAHTLYHYNPVPTPHWEPMAIAAPELTSPEYGTLAVPSWRAGDFEYLPSSALVAQSATMATMAQNQVTSPIDWADGRLTLATDQNLLAYWDATAGEFHHLQAIQPLNAGDTYVKGQLVYVVAQAATGTATAELTVYRAMVDTDTSVADNLPDGTNAPTHWQKIGGEGGTTIADWSSTEHYSLGDIVLAATSQYGRTVTLLYRCILGATNDDPRTVGTLGWETVGAVANGDTVTTGGVYHHIPAAHSGTLVPALPHLDAHTVVTPDGVYISVIDPMTDATVLLRSEAKASTIMTDTATFVQPTTTSTGSALVQGTVSVDHLTGDIWLYDGATWQDSGRNVDMTLYQWDGAQWELTAIAPPQWRPLLHLDAASKSITEYATYSSLPASGTTAQGALAHVLGEAAIYRNDASDGWQYIIGLPDYSAQGDKEVVLTGSYENDRIGWESTAGKFVVMDDMADMNDAVELPDSQLENGKVVFNTDTQRFYQFLPATTNDRTLNDADWMPIGDRVTIVADAASLPDPVFDNVPDGATYLIGSSATGDDLNRLAVWDETLSTWIYPDPHTFVKHTIAGIDADSDRQTGDTQYTTESGHAEIKVYDNVAGAWITLYSEDDVKDWIAQTGRFKGVIQETGGSTTGATELSAVPAETSLGVNDGGKYYVWQGTDGHTIAAAELGGVASSIDGATLSSGNWLQIANTGTPTSPVMRYVIIRGDILSAARAKSLWSFEPWTDGAYEIGTVRSFQGGLYKVAGNVVAGHVAPEGAGSQWVKLDITGLLHHATNDAGLPATAPQDQLWYVEASTGGNPTIKYFDGAAWQSLISAGTLSGGTGSKAQFSTAQGFELTVDGHLLFQAVLAADPRENGEYHISAVNHRITNVRDPLLDHDVVNLEYLEKRLQDVLPTGSVQLYRGGVIETTPVITGAVGGQVITLVDAGGVGSGSGFEMQATVNGTGNKIVSLDKITNGGRDYDVNDVIQLTVKHEHGVTAAPLGTPVAHIVVMELVHVAHVAFAKDAPASIDGSYLNSLHPSDGTLMITGDKGTAHHFLKVSRDGVLEDVYAGGLTTVLSNPKHFEVLQYNGANWVNAAINLVPNGGTNGDLLVWNATTSRWEPEQPRGLIHYNGVTGDRSFGGLESFAHTTVKGGIYRVTAHYDAVWGHDYNYINIKLHFNSVVKSWSHAVGSAYKANESIEMTVVGTGGADVFYLEMTGSGGALHSYYWTIERL